MNDKVLTDEEKDALLTGVESGEVEVQSSSGPQYASVKPFTIPPRAHIVSNSYPRLKLLNQQTAERLVADLEQLLQRELTLEAGALSVASFDDVAATMSGPVVVAVFEAPPFEGRAAVVLEPVLVRMLVSAFFGGDATADEIPESKPFTDGEISISNLFVTLVLSAIKESWTPLKELSPERIATEASLELVDVTEPSEPVINSEFELAVDDVSSRFHLLLPRATVAPVLSTLAGEKRERDAREDARWEKAIRRRVADSVVNLTSSVGHARMTLGDLVRLTPGDVIEIDNPQQATVQAKHVELLHGRLGVHRGRNAIETLAWIESQL